MLALFLLGWVVRPGPVAMNTTENQSDAKGACKAGCPNCMSQQAPPKDADLTGWAMAGTVVVVFVVPMVLATVGAIGLPLVWANPNSEFVGGFAGLGLGVANAIWMMKRRSASPSPSAGAGSTCQSETKNHDKP